MEPNIALVLFVSFSFFPIDRTNSSQWNKGEKTNKIPTPVLIKFILYGIFFSVLFAIFLSKSRQEKSSNIGSLSGLHVDDE